MPFRIKLRVTQGPLKGMEYVFPDRTSTILGRGVDCHPRLPDDEAHQTISRHHCLLDVNPPRARIRDLGSLNGTWVNGRVIGRRSGPEAPERTVVEDYREHDLNDGDQVRLGETVYLVSVETGDPEDVTRREESVFGTTETLDRRERSGGQAGVPGEKDPAALLRVLAEGIKKGDKSVACLRGLSVVRMLGRGASGVAYLVRRGKSGEPLALKILMPQGGLGQGDAPMFMREVENTKALRHPNVVRLFDSAGYGGLLFYTMDYCNGGSLEDLRAKRGGRVSLKEALPLVLQALDGLDYIHNAEIPRVRLADGSYGRGRGLVHRDLKPGNIFLSVRGKAVTAKIADVGVGKAFDTAGLSGLTRTGAVAGTPVFMPRQQIINFKYAKPDVDVWALAATFYRIISGAYPRDFDTGKDPWRVVLETQPVPIRQRAPQVPEALARVIDRALIDNPEILFQGAAELKKAIQAAL
ncbi:MAG: FHA domain-containing protein [Proteobacteria bacterium]|nr:FHA domain-containing protein [Pseudomonadota bacterium]